MWNKIIAGGHNNYFARMFNFSTMKKVPTKPMQKISNFKFDTIKAAEPLYNMKKKPIKGNLNPYFFCNLETVLKNYKIF